MPKAVKINKNAKVEGLNITEQNTTDNRTMHNETYNIPKVENNTRNNYNVTVNQGASSDKNNSKKSEANVAILHYLGNGYSLIMKMRFFP